MKSKLFKQSAKNLHKGSPTQLNEDKPREEWLNEFNSSLLGIFKDMPDSKKVVVQPRKTEKNHRGQANSSLNVANNLFKKMLYNTSPLRGKVFPNLNSSASPAPKESHGL